MYEPLYFDLSYTVEAVFVYEPLVLALPYTKTPLLVYGTWLPGGSSPIIQKFFYTFVPDKGVYSSCRRYLKREAGESPELCPQL